MIIPPGYSHVIHKFAGVILPEGAAVTYGIQNEGALGIAERTNLVHDIFTLNVLPQLSVGVTLSETLVKYGPNATGQQYAVSGTATGGVSGGVAAANTAYLVQKRTFLGGRAGRGRMFLPGVTTGTMNDNSTISPTKQVNLQAAVDAFLAELETEVGPMVLLHSASSDPTTVQSLPVQSRLATQRRRLR